MFRICYLLICLISISSHAASFTETFKKAQQGDAQAQLSVGQQYYKGRNYPQAKKWFELAAKQDNAQAQAELGKLYYLGLGTDKDLTSAQLWLEKSASKNTIDANYYLANIYINDKTTAQQAIPLYQQAAQQGNAKAQNQLAYLYLTGKYVKKDYKLAFIWFSKAAQQDNLYAQYHLGNIYLKGKGVKRDKQQAYLWFYIARYNGHKQAIYTVDNLTATMSEQQLSLSRNLAQQCLKSQLKNCSFEDKTLNQANLQNSLPHG